MTGAVGVLSFIGLIFAAGVVQHFYNAARNNKSIKSSIKNKWGKIPKDQPNYDDLKYISSYFNYKSEVNKDAFFIDGITWNDLDMDRVFTRINNTQSTVGEECLYSMLREPCFEEDVLKKRNETIKFFQDHREDRESLQFMLAGLGKRNAVTISDYFDGILTSRNRPAIIYRILSLAAITTPLVMLVNINLGVLLLILSFITNATVYYKAKNEMGSQLESLSYVVSLIHCANKIAASDIKGIDSYKKELTQYLKHIRTISKKAFNLFYSNGDVLVEYGKIILLKEIIDYESICRMINKHTEDLENTYRIVGTLDALISVASFRQSLPLYAEPILYKYTQDSSRNLACTELYHPLIKEPVSNSLNTGKSILITGSNASGKSTFLKALAINGILAQTTYTALAREYTSTFFAIYTSMALKDNIMNNESYYVAEIKSLKRIIDSLNNSIPCLCFIDEVLRGTNTVERIAASSEVLHHLSRNNCLCISATHDIELTNILKKHFENYHFQETITDNEISFDYKLYPGKSCTRNAIKLLKFIGYSSAIVSGAEERAGNFISEGKWNTIG